MLHTTVSSRIELQMPLSAARALCRRLVAELGWQVVCRDDDSVKVKEDERRGREREFVWPAEVELKLIVDAAGVTCILLKGRSFGNGPRQKGHLEAHLADIRSRIEGIAGDS